MTARHALPAALVLLLSAPAFADEARLFGNFAPRTPPAGTDSHEVWVNRFPPRPEKDEVVKKAEPENRKEAYSAGLLVGTGAPSIINMGITAKVSRYVGLGASFGMIPTVKLDLYGEATVSYQAYEAYARVHPFGGAFFFGSGVGYATVKATFTRNVSIPAVTGLMEAQELSVKGEGSVRSLVVTPHVGYMAITRVGFTFGFDVGAQVPISSSDVRVSTNLPAEVSMVPGDPAGEATSKVASTLRRVGEQVLPVVKVRIGWMF